MGKCGVALHALPVIIGATLLILAAEVLLWRLFRHKFSGLLLPVEVDTSVFRISTPRFLGFFAFTHTLVLIIIVDLLLSFFW